MLLLSLSTLLLVYDFRSKDYGITYCVEVPLMGRLTAANLEALIDQTQVHVFVVNPDGLLRHLNQVIFVLPILLRGQVERL